VAIRYHHLPKEFTDIFVNIYENNFITVAVKTEWTNSIKIDRGVLQGDPSSPLLFNMGFNTLMQTLDQPMYRKLAYTWGAVNSTQQRGWLQYTDDAIIVSSDSKSAKGLLNVFQAWSAWSSMAG